MSGHGLQQHAGIGVAGATRRGGVQTGVIAGLVAALVVGTFPPGAMAAPVSESSVGVNRQEPLIRPSEVGNGNVDGLQYADPAEGLALVAPPEGSSSGVASVTYPFVIPPGRGITPNVQLTYASGGTSTWAGYGWDLSVGDISVDTRFGAPHFSQTKESETYVLDGDVLVPNATDEAWLIRLEGDRQDYTRQTETAYEQIIRHDADDGDAQSTDDYYWEVRDKGGNIRWYGGFPDAGGPYGDLQEGGETIDRSAIVYDDDGNAVRWLLSAQRDVGVNVIRYFYDTPDYVRTTNGWSQQDCDPAGTVMCGRHTYLTRIAYTEAAEVAPDPADPDPENRAGGAWEGDAAYEVHFLRESATDPKAKIRSDTVVDASGRYVDVLLDRLARIEVRHGKPAGGQDRNYNEVAVRYDLAYETGPFGKSLLKSVTQVATAPDESATHTFTYNDEVLADNGDYDGFADRTKWDTGEDLADKSYLDESVALGALGSSESNSAEGHGYFGFNALIPQKVGSFGVSLQIGGGGTEAISEWIDLNGDGLPDKVFDDGGNLAFRLNTSGPDGGDTFSDRDPVGGDLSRLSRETNVNFQLSVESHIVVTAIFGLGLQVSIGDSYFTDVNADGLPDFVTGGSVYFNRIVDGIPTFQTGSSGTIVPLPTDGGTPVVESDQLDEVQADLEAASPPLDTVRRWTAPMPGTVSIEAPVKLATESVDGVRVAIQHEDEEFVSANLLTPATTAFTSASSRSVAKGDHLYFRVGSVADGQGDEVTWDPTITYTAIDGVGDVAAVTGDLNGLSQTVYSASGDFTLAGRPNSAAVMPYTGSVTVTADITKGQVTSDELRVVVLHNGQPVTVSDNVVPAAFVGDQSVTASFTVAGPEYPTEAFPDRESKQDSVEVYLAVDSPIDLTAVSWRPQLVYTSATDADGAAVAVVDDQGKPIIKVDLLPEIEQYPNRSGASTAKPFTAGATGTFDVVAAISRAVDSPAGELVATIKTTSGALVAKGSVDLSASLLGGAQSAVIDVNAALTAGTQYYADVMIRDPQLSDTTTFSSASLRPDGAADATGDVEIAAELRWRGRQTIFPLAYRGWSVAGYTAGGTKATQPIDPTAFEVSEADFDDSNAPDGFDDINAGDPGSQVEPAYAFIPVPVWPDLPGQPAAIEGAHWRGPRTNHAVAPGIMRTSLLGADSVAVGGANAGGDGRGVTRVGIAAPSAALAVGIGPLGGSFGTSPSFGLVDFSDMNADGYPDVITPSSVHFTDQRGAFLDASTSVDDLAVANQDLTFSASGGLSVKLVDIKGNAKGKTNATQGPAASKGGDAGDSGGGASIAGGLSASWTSPNESGGASGVPSTYDDAVSEIPDESTGGTAPIQIALADVNGDGLADRVFTTPQGVFAQYNLGYRFTSQSVKLTTGGFQSMESYAGNVSFGFSTPWAEFGGGAAFNWNYDQARYTWNDVNGDGLLDQVRKIDGDNPPMVAFGTGSGVLAPVEYGDVEYIDNGGLVPSGQQVSFDRASGAGGGFDFTVYVGPLCLVACYLIINPGASFQNSVSSTQVDLEDVNGDGYPDSVSTTDDDELFVRLNNAGRTNLLESVANPLGGTFTLTYDRFGNTVEHPDTTWALTKVSVDDNREGDGADVQAISYDYSGLAFDRVHRQSLGFSQVTATERDTTDANKPARITTTTYLNDNIFVAGLDSSVQVTTPSGALLQRAQTTWEFRDVRDVVPGFDVLAPVITRDLSLIGDTDSVASRGRSIAPLAVRVKEETFEGGDPAQDTSQIFGFDGLGNVLTQRDVGEPEDPNDDLLATYDYSDCDPGSDPNVNLSASTMDEGTKYPNGCLGTVTRPSPIWSAELCPTWVSLPVAVRITNNKTGPGEVVYRQRDGRAAICDNASQTLLAESIDGTSPTPLVSPPDAPTDDCTDVGLAITQLTYDSWGSYNRISYPPNRDCVSYSVRYVYDSDGQGKVSSVTEFDLRPDQVEAFLEGTDVSSEVLTDPDVATGLTSVATFDPLSGRVAKRTDANGNSVTYTYDSLGRIKTVGSPRPQDTEPLITFDYKPSAPGYGYALAAHLDVFNPGNPITTYTFVDGIGRTTQTKRDARLFQGAGVPPVVGRSVSGATTYDALGRITTQYYPTQDTAAATAFETQQSTVDPEKTTWDLRDRPTKITAPGDRVTDFSYGVAAATTGGPEYATTKIVEPNLRATTTYVDVRDITVGSDDQPAALADPLKSRYAHDAMGQLRTVKDVVGNQSAHTYDLLGRRVSTNTPDGGLVEYTFDAESKLVSKVTPNLRAAGTSIDYTYAFGRLTGIDHPEGTPDVSYRYGQAGDGINGAGRVIREEDGSRIVTSQYAPSGAVAKQTAEMKYHDWFNAGTDKSKFQTTMTWDYDGLGRIASIGYPDSEVVTYDYDEGGLARTVDGVEEGFEKVQVGTDADGNPIFEDQPRTWTYDYLSDRQYDAFFDPRFERMGNNVTTEYTPDANTRWLSRQQSFSPNRSVTDAKYQEIQDLNYTYDKVGNPTEYRNSLPPALASEFGGTTVQKYRYDPLERVVGASAIYDLANKRHQRYELSLTYDANGNVTSKNQYDATVKKPIPASPVSAGPAKGDIPKADTTYSFSRTYTREAPHQATRDASGTYLYDANGNLNGILETAPNKWVRKLTHDATDRVTVVDDDSSDTTYVYDDTGQRTIERGPNGGETAFVNPWVTTRNKNEMYKHIWVDNQRLSTQRDDGPYEELKRYFLHKDLQGSTNMVTDYLGDTFQHHEYFATGEVWIDEKSTQFRTPYQYGGGYVDDARDLINFGARWYDQDREMFYSPDPALYDDPTAIVGKPGLAWAYAFAGSNPVTNVDPTGYEFFTAQSAKAVTRKYKAERKFIASQPAIAATVVANLDTRIPRFLVKRGVTVDPKKDKIQQVSELLDNKPLVEFNLSKGTVQLSAGIGKQFTVLKRKAAANVAAAAAPVAAPAPALAAPTKPLPPLPTGVAPRRAKPLPPLPPGAAAAPVARVDD